MCLTPFLFGGLEGDSFFCDDIFVRETLCLNFFEVFLHVHEKRHDVFFCTSPRARLHRCVTSAFANVRIRYVEHLLEAIRFLG